MAVSDDGVGNEWAQFIGEPLDGGDSVRIRRTALEHCARSIGEDTVKRSHPLSCCAEAQRVGAGCIRGGHSSDRGEASARGVNGKTQTGSLCDSAHLRADCARPNPDSLAVDVRLSNPVDATHVEDHAGPDRTACHTRRGAARHKRNSLVSSPSYEGHDIISVDGNRNPHWYDTPNACSFGVDRTRVVVGAEDTAKSLRRG